MGPPCSPAGLTFRRLLLAALPVGCPAPPAVPDLPVQPAPAATIISRLAALSTPTLAGRLGTCPSVGAHPRRSDAGALRAKRGHPDRVPGAPRRPRWLGELMRVLRGRQVQDQVRCTAIRADLISPGTEHDSVASRL